MRQLQQVTWKIDYCLKLLEKPHGEQWWDVRVQDQELDDPNQGLSALPPIID